MLLKVVQKVPSIHRALKITDDQVLRARESSSDFTLSKIGNRTLGGMY